MVSKTGVDAHSPCHGIHSGPGSFDDGIHFLMLRGGDGDVDVVVDAPCLEFCGTESGIGVSSNVFDSLCSAERHGRGEKFLQSVDN